MSVKLYSRELCSTIDTFKIPKMSTYTWADFPNIGALALQGIASLQSRFGWKSIIRRLLKFAWPLQGKSIWASKC
jgi:hypothetical protein